MGLSMFYITVEWCQQSFLSTEDYADAMDGLRKTRTYRHSTFFLRWLSRQLSRWSLDPMEKLAVIVGLIKKQQKTLVWTKHHTWDPVVPPSPRQTTTSFPTYPNASPSIELTDYSTNVPHTEIFIHDTPAMAHSLFPPAIPTRRPRNESDASLLPPNRRSDDSSAPLIQRPSETYHQGAEPESRRSGEGRVSFEETWSPASPPDAGPVYDGWRAPDGTLHSRQGYQRANSDPGSLPVEIRDMAQSGLGIHVRNTDSDLERGRS